MPLYTHDCDKCQFLGSFNGDDLYFCGSDYGDGTVIARHSSEGSDYISGITFGMMRRNDSDSAIGEAYRRAIVAGCFDAPSIRISSYDLSEFRRWYPDVTVDDAYLSACRELAMDRGQTTVDYGVLNSVRLRRKEGR